MNDADAAAKTANAQAAFAKLQLAVASVLANPSLGDVLNDLDKRRASRIAGDDLTAAFLSNGAPLPKDVKVSVQPGDGAEGKIMLAICADWGGTSHCVSVVLQSPIQIEV
jgi:hypothetical protein